MSVSDTDRNFLERCVALAARAVAQGDEPFGSLLVSAGGDVLLEDHNHVGDGDGTRHPELAIAQWAAAHVAPVQRPAMTVYTSGEHCPMCSAAHAWAGLGRIVFASSTAQLVGWLADLGVAPSPVAPLPISQVAPGLRAEGPVPGLDEQVRALHERYHDDRRQSGRPR